MPSIDRRPWTTRFSVFKYIVRMCGTRVNAIPGDASGIVTEVARYHPGPPKRRGSCSAF
jgi:hypothetical protein